MIDTDFLCRSRLFRGFTKEEIKSLLECLNAAVKTYRKGEYIFQAGEVTEHFGMILEDIEAIVRPCGLGKSKARDISACMKILHEQYHDNVPEDFDALLKLPGVGRKSANLIMGDVFGKPAIVTDTHCIRLSNRIGLVDHIKEPKKVEMALWKIIPPEEGNDLCHRLVNHGRDVCTARTKPYCDRCCLNDICEKNGVD
jgi:endonuclease III